MVPAHLSIISRSFLLRRGEFDLVFMADSVVLVNIGATLGKKVDVLCSSIRDAAVGFCS